MLSSSRLAQWMASGARRYANDGNARLWPVGLAMAMAAVGALWPETPVQSEGAVSVDAHAVGVGAGLHLARNIEWEARRRHAKAMQTHQLPIYKDVKQQYRMEAVIGQGGFGLVHSAYDTRSQDAVAIKHVDKRNTSKAKFMQEVDILREMGGKKNVVGLREAFETSDAYVLVTELVEGEELFDRLIQEGTFTEREAKPLVHKLAETLAYLHAHRVVHGDLKPENILLSEDSSMRLIDFGQSFRLNSSSSARSPRNSKCVATMAYAAPEVLRGEVAATGSGVDMWALGIVLYILLVGHHPFDPTNDATDEVLRDRILEGEIDTKAEDWQNLSESAKNIITRLLQSDPAERLTANQVLHDSWMQ